MATGTFTSGTLKEASQEAFNSSRSRLRSSYTSPSRPPLALSRLAVTFATSRKLGVPSLRWRTSQRLAARLDSADAKSGTIPTWIHHVS